MEKDQTNLLITISSFLEKHKIPYMLTGALTVVYYGRPRASHDIDFVVEINKKDVKRVINIFKNLSSEYLVQAESIEDAVIKKSMFNVIYLPTYTKLDFWLLTEVIFDQERFERRKKVKLLGKNMVLSTPEDTIIQKLLWYKDGEIEKHIVDAAFTYQIQRKRLDKKYLTHWVKELNLTTNYKKLNKIDLEKYL
ncbi:hypothetical protein A2954_00650 [Candidatus Roizmanbacteria bacterium RIFCSPLOWO2_01_FULL_37_12]|uniref:Uncharacterized protein n=1 Tax=Candidatus Roizmanbacteria bacterium RIFCSPLOWO2_01_FULL_37_12 TaxID=1802056 RepID=A0A1F7IDR3_9BACT|nr:MAG: hypothetical protein A2954_00650 [Candidatus Roizmanbacteria bacterium RIFCSPLOWO2_01_FULL_37_12]